MDVRTAPVGGWRGLPNPSAEAVRNVIDHPIIDADGHCLEFLPAVREILREVAGDAVDAAFWKTFLLMREAANATTSQRRDLGIMRPPWWAFPAENTLDRATAMLPRLFHRRLDELGIDGVELCIGDGSLGWAAGAPYDAVLVTAGAPRVPEALWQQLKPGGRITVPVGDRSVQTLKVFERDQDDRRETKLCDCRFVQLVGQDGW